MNPKINKLRSELEKNNGKIAALQVRPRAGRFSFASGADVWGLAWAGGIPVTTPSEDGRHATQL